MALKLLIEVCCATGQTGFYFRSTDTWLFIPEGAAASAGPVRGKDGPFRRGGETDVSARPGDVNCTLTLIFVTGVSLKGTQH